MSATGKKIKISYIILKENREYNISTNSNDPRNMKMMFLIGAWVHEAQGLRKIDPVPSCTILYSKENASIIQLRKEITPET